MNKKLLKRLFSAALAGGMAVSLASCGDSGSSDKAESDTIKIGVIEDFSGDNSGIGIPKQAAYRFAADEINAAGGINGKQIELIEADGQSDTNVYQQMARKLTGEDEVDVLMGGITSASREAIRPIMDETETLYFYNQQYEGGVADHYTFCTGGLPEQQIFPMMEKLIPEYGGRCYIVAADYNFGQITAKWMQNKIEELGGEVLGCEFIPLGVSQFSSTVAKIRAAQPDIIIPLVVGAAQSAFYTQWYNEGTPGIPMASPVVINESYEHKVFEAPIMENVYFTAQFVEEMDTPAAREFVEKFRAKYDESKVQYMNMEVESVYVGMYLYKAAVEKAGTTDTEAVIAALESGEISFDGPGGLVTIRGEDHQTKRDMTLFRVNENHEIETIETYKQVESNYVEDMIKENFDVDGGLAALGKDAPNVQYEPTVG